LLKQLHAEFFDFLIKLTN